MVSTLKYDMFVVKQKVYVPAGEVSGINMYWYMSTATMKQHNIIGPMIAPSIPIQYIPPAMAKAVRYGWPLQNKLHL